MTHADLVQGYLSGKLVPLATVDYSHNLRMSLTTLGNGDTDSIEKDLIIGILPLKADKSASKPSIDWQIARDMLWNFQVSICPSLSRWKSPYRIRFQEIHGSPIAKGG